MTDKLKKTVTLDYITLEFYEHYFVGTPEDVNMGLKEVKELANLANEFYTGNFGYIGNRKNLNSVSPIVYKYVETNIPKLTAAAVVSYSYYTEKFLELEKKFHSGKFKFKIFTELEKAKEWMRSNFV